MQAAIAQLRSSLFTTVMKGYTCAALNSENQWSFEGQAVCGREGHFLEG